MIRMTFASLALMLLAGTAPAPTLTARIVTDTVDYAAPVTVDVAFENRTEEVIRYHEPEHAPRVTFPRVRYVNVETGDAWVSYVAPFQAMAATGMRGRVVTLAPGEKQEYRMPRDRFGPVDRVLGKTDWKDKVPLPPGTYRVEAVYERTHDKVSFVTDGVESEMRSVPGIFVGKVSAKPVTFTVRRPDRPRIDIAPSKDGSAAVWLTFDNPTAKEWTFRGRPILKVHSKAYGGGYATPAVVRDGDIGREEPFELSVPAGEKRQFLVRMRALNFYGRASDPYGLGEIIPLGLAHTRFSLKGESEFSTDGIFIHIPRPKDAGMEGLAVTVAAPAEVKAGEAVKLEVEVTNCAKKDRLILHRLAFPRDVVIRIQDATGKRRTIGSVSRKAGGLDALRPGGEGASKVAEGLTWDGAAFNSAPGVTRKDFVAIEPGDGIGKTFDLGKLLAKGFTPGTYRIRVGYRNYESGERLGIAAEHRAPVGIVWSEPVELTVR